MKAQTKKRIEIYSCWFLSTLIAIAIITILYWERIPSHLPIFVGIDLFIGIAAAICIAFAYRREIGW